jgi:glucose-1-phosphate thymidylyltransferase
VEEVILIVSPQQTDVEEYARSATAVPIVMVSQNEPRGQAHAISLVREHVDGPVLIVFSDTLADATFDHLGDVTSDGLIYVKEIADPSRMGIITVRDGRITDMVEKPQNPTSNLATIGMYYFRTSDVMFDAVDRVLAAPPKLNDEYFLADAIKLMIEDGRFLEPYVVGIWEDTGTPDATLHAHRYLLDRSGGSPRARPTVTVIPPVFIADDAELSESVVGPYVTVESGCRVERSVLSDCILDENSTVSQQVLTRSLIGRRAELVGTPVAVNLGDDAKILPPDEGPLPEL